MYSAELGQFGFVQWVEFSRIGEKVLLQRVSEQFGTYVLRQPRPRERSRGESDILYIGSATNRGGLRMRLRQYFHPGSTQWTNKRVLAFLGERRDISVSWTIMNDVTSARGLEKRLRLYESDHFELPPLNRRH